MPKRAWTIIGIQSNKIEKQPVTEESDVGGLVLAGRQLLGAGKQQCAGQLRRRREYFSHYE